jgi:hypothetical protein
MKAIDTEEKLNHILHNDSIKIDDAALYDICLKGQGKRTCKYIMRSENGFFCAKNTELKEYLDGLSKDGEIGCSGDNCQGR